MTKQSDSSVAWTAALAAISGVTTRCELPPPAPEVSGKPLDLSRLNVVYTASSGAGACVVPEDTRTGCDQGANGWQYSAENASIRLCGASYDQVRSDPNARLDVVLGCPVQGPG